MKISFLNEKGKNEARDCLKYKNVKRKLKLNTNNINLNIGINKETDKEKE